MKEIPTPRKYIEEIRNKQIKSDKEFILDSLTGAIEKLEKAFPRYGSFLMEFVQNADDAKSHSLKIELLQNTIRIFNDGIPFSEENVKSICKVGRSSKTPKEYIGYLGVGFKAVFLISDCPEIYSGDFRFKFDKNACDDPAHTPWQVIPLWIDKPKIELSEKYKTIFNLPLKEIKLIEKMKEEVKQEHLSDRILLFLRYVKEIEILNSNQNFKRKIIKSLNLSKTSDYEIYQIQQYENEVLKNQDRWLIFRSSPNVPTKVKEDYITKEWERENIDKRDVLVAFKLGEGDSIVVERKGTAHIGVFSFLPLKEIPSGLNFSIQADFLTTPGRGELARECLWNDWIADEVYNLIINKCIPTFLKHDKWKMNFTEILYSLEGGHELFGSHIKNPLRKYIETNAVLIAEDGTPTKVEELVSIDKEVKKLFTKEDIQIQYPKKKILHEDCKAYPNFKLEKAPINVYEFIASTKSEGLIKQKSEIGDFEWFNKLYSQLSDKFSYQYFQLNNPRYNVAFDEFWDGMRNFNKPIILTTNKGLSKINECYITPKKLKIPEQIKGQFKLVHPELVKSEKFKELMKKLNEERHHSSPPSTKVIRELTEEDIKNALKKQEYLELDNKKWVKLPEKEKVEKIKNFRDLWSKGYLSLEDFNYLTLKTKKGKWLVSRQ